MFACTAITVMFQYKYDFLKNVLHHCTKDEKPGFCICKNKGAGAR